MKTKLIFLSIPFLLLTLNSIGQDTLILYKDYRYKYGIKLISEHSENIPTRENNHVFCGGFQVIRKIKSTASSFESGIYINTKVYEYDLFLKNPYDSLSRIFVPVIVDYHYLSIPLNYRLDTRAIYFSTGIFADFFLFKSVRQYEAYFDSIDHYLIDNKFQLGYNLNIGMEKPVSNALSLYVEARIAFTVSSLESGGLFYPHRDPRTNTNYGFAIGINYARIRKTS